MTFKLIGRFTLSAVAMISIWCCRMVVTAELESPSLKTAYDRDFLIGVAVGGTLPDDYTNKEIKTITGNFNAVTAENCMKPSWIHPERDRWDFVQADAVVEFARDNHLHVFGHTLMYPHLTSDWFLKEKGENVSREQA